MDMNLRRLTAAAGQSPGWQLAGRAPGDAAPGRLGRRRPRQRPRSSIAGAAGATRSGRRSAEPPFRRIQLPAAPAPPQKPPAQTAPAGAPPGVPIRPPAAGMPGKPGAPESIAEWVFALGSAERQPACICPPDLSAKRPARTVAGTPGWALRPRDGSSQRWQAHRRRPSLGQTERPRPGGIDPGTDFHCQAAPAGNPAPARLGLGSNRRQWSHSAAGGHSAEICRRPLRARGRRSGPSGSADGDGGRPVMRIAPLARWSRGP